MLICEVPKANDMWLVVDGHVLNAQHTWHTSACIDSHDRLPSQRNVLQVSCHSLSNKTEGIQHSDLHPGQGACLPPHWTYPPPVKLKQVWQARVSGIVYAALTC